MWFDTIYSSISFGDLLITHITRNKESSFPLQHQISYKAVEVQGTKTQEEEGGKKLSEFGSQGRDRKRMKERKETGGKEEESRKKQCE